MEIENRLTFIRFDHIEVYIRPRTGYKEKIVYDLYECSCGNKKVLRRSLVQSKRRSSTFSCGCLKKENIERLNREGKNRLTKGGKIKGHVAHNKGKIAIMREGKRKYITPQQLKEMYYGVENLMN